MDIRVYPSLTELPDDLRAGCRYPVQGDFFLSLDWFECLYEGALQAELTPHVYVLHDAAGNSRAALFCAVGADPRQLLSLTNYYTMAFAPVILDPTLAVREAAAAFARFIAAERPRWHGVDLRLMPADMLSDSDLPGALARVGFNGECFDQYENWYLPVAGQGFDDYYASRSSRLRNTITRKEKKLRKAHDVRIRIFTEDDAELDGAIADYVAIYNSSWKQPEPYPAFIPRLAHSCARLGLLRLGVLWIDDQAAAAQLWINTPHKALIYKLAYREEFASHSPGSILSRELFRQALDQDRVAEVDYGIGSEGYKRDWMTESRQLQGLVAHNPRTLKGLGRLAGTALKAALRPLKRD